MLLLLFSFISGVLACSPNSGTGGPGALKSAISFKMDVSPPETWTIPLTPAQAATSQARTRQVARRRIRNDIQQSVSDILKQYNFPPNQATCTPTVQSFVQGELTTERCTKNGQILSIDGTVYFNCSTAALARGKREVGDGEETATTEDVGETSTAASPASTTISVSSTSTSTQSTTSAVETTTSRAPVPLACVFVMDWDYLGNGPEAIAEYNKQRDFISEIAKGLYNSAQLNFSAMAGQFGFSDQGPGLDLVLYNYDRFTSYLRRPLSNAPEISYCQILQELSDNIDRLQEFERKCLIFITGKHYEECQEESSSLAPRRQKREIDVGSITSQFGGKVIGVTINGSESPFASQGMSFDVADFREETTQVLVSELVRQIEALVEDGTSSPDPTPSVTMPTITRTTEDNSISKETVTAGPSTVFGMTPTIATANPATASQATPTTRSSTTSPQPSFVRHNVAMAITVNCTSLTLATTEMWNKFLQKLQQRLQKRKVSFNKNLSL